MQYRKFGRAGWQIGEIGYGMWGMGDWTGSDDEESLQLARQPSDVSTLLSPALDKPTRQRQQQQGDDAIGGPL